MKYEFICKDIVATEDGLLATLFPYSIDQTVMGPSIQLLAHLSDDGFRVGCIYEFVIDQKI